MLYPLFLGCLPREQMSFFAIPHAIISLEK